MNSRWIRWAAVAAAVVGAIWALGQFGFGREREWTTRSPEALAAFQEGLDARMRLYEAEAATSFRRAVELDPQFAAARFMLAGTARMPEERKQQVEELGAANVERLTARERFFVEIALANSDRARIEEITARALATHPDDPWVLYMAANQSWDREEWAEADRLYRALLELDPNWVVAHNHLGYIAMSKSRFDRAEEHFRTYAYVAPDQANPHDSLGELLALTGRYEEARAEIELALAEKPDFCASYMNLIGVAFFEGRTETIEPVLERMRKNCPEPMFEEVECDTKIAAAFFERDFERPWREGFVDCAGEPGKRGVLFHRLALLTGRTGDAIAEEAAIAKMQEESEAAGRGKGRRTELELAHERGVRALFAGHAEEAAAEFRKADEQGSYWGASEGRLKLFNLVHLAIALERNNDPEGARRALDAANAVNRVFTKTASGRIGDLSPKG